MKKSSLSKGIVKCLHKTNLRSVRLGSVVLIKNKLKMESSKKDRHVRFTTISCCLMPGKGRDTSSERQGVRFSPRVQDIVRVCVRMCVCDVSKL